MKRNKNNKLRIQYTIFPDGSKLYPAPAEKYWNGDRLRKSVAVGLIILWIILIILTS